jgi:hypothetical protein
MSHVKSRVAILLIDAFLAITAIAGAIFVVPTLPHDWLQNGLFSDYTIPALALGVPVGGSALVAAASVLFNAKFGAAAAVVSGLMIISFELVEIATVGLSVVVHGAGMPQSWLQPIFIVIGIALAILGGRLWLSEGGLDPFAHRSSTGPGAPALSGR